MAICEVMACFLISATVSLALATDEDTLSNYREVSGCENGSSPPCPPPGVTAALPDPEAELVTNESKTSGDKGQGQGQGQDKGHSSKDTKNNNNKPDTVDDPYDRRGRYWLVPPFLIGASSVIVMYIFMHCLYLHCYAKRKIRRMSESKAAPTTPTFMLNDASNFDGTNGQAFTPMVKYEGAYGKTEVVEAQPFLICHPMDGEEEQQQQTPPNQAQQKNTKRRGIQLQLPKIFGGRSEPRHSVVSTSAADAAEAPENSERMQKTRASICFVPVGRTISDPSGSSGQTEWTPLQGFVYSSFVLSRKPSYNQAVNNGPVGSEPRLTDSGGSLPTCMEDDLSPPILIVPSDESGRIGGIPDTDVAAGITITISGSSDMEDIEHVEREHMEPTVQKTTEPQHRIGTAGGHNV